MEKLNNVKKYGAIFGSLLCVSLNAASIGIIGGQQDGASAPSPCYAAFVASDGSLIPITSTPVSLPVNGELNSVAINSSGIGLIGGHDFTAGAPAYAALVSPNGSAKSLSIPSGVAGAGIYSVAINTSGTGVVGGQDFAASTPIAAFVAPDGTVSSFFPLAPFTSGIIFGVDINDSGKALIGGQNFITGPYAAFVATDGTVTSLAPSLPNMGGNIMSVAINASNVGLIGGQDYNIDFAYAAFVYTDGTVTSLEASLPSNGRINWVALNDSSTGIVGGQDGSNAAYAAVVTPSTVIAVTSSPLPLPASGSIKCVAINASGMGLIGGADNALLRPAYAALVFPDGSAMSLSSLPTTGVINGVAIDDTGIGLIGGQDQSAGFPNFSAFAALVAPDGTVTPISSLPAIGDIGPNNGGVAITEQTLASVVSALVPKSYGPFNSVFNVMFDLTKVLERHYVMHHKNKTFKQLERSEKKVSKEIGLLADANMDIRMHRPDQKKPTISVWASGFGDYVRQKAEEKIPSFTNKIAGVVAAAEYGFFDDRNAVVGGGLAYAFNDVHYGQRFGHSSINQEFAVVYGSFNKPHFFVNAALWGGLYQSHTKRNSTIAFTTVEISSRSNPKGWLLSPHLELSAPYYKTWNDWFMMEPFIMFDWANSWQRHFKEHGSSGFNIALDSQHFSMLRSEAGVRFYEVLQYEWGRFIIEEKGSYVNKKPFHTGASSAIFVGSISSFAIETFSNKVQNLGVAQVSFNFIPRSPKYPYGALDFQGEFGSTFQSYLLVLNLGKDF